MKKILILFICLGILMTSSVSVFAGDETDPYIQSNIFNTNNKHK